MSESPDTYTNDVEVEQYPFQPWLFPPTLFHPPFPFFRPFFSPFFFRPFPRRRRFFRHPGFIFQSEESSAQIEQRFPAPPPPPPGPPPFAPPRQQFVDPRSLRRCLNRLVFIWRKGRRQPFWAWLTVVRQNVVTGYRWNERRQRWMPFTMRIAEIARFRCY